MSLRSLAFSLGRSLPSTITNHQSPIMFFDYLPDLNDEALEEKMEQIAEADRELNLRLYQLLPFLHPQEKLALASISIWLIDQTDAQPISITSRKGDFADALKQAIEVVEQLSPGGKAQLASEILAQIFDTEELVLDPPSITLE
jgi:hypothetical protein